MIGAKIGFIADNIGPMWSWNPGGVAGFPERGRRRPKNRRPPPRPAGVGAPADHDDGSLCEGGGWGAEAGVEDGLTHGSYPTVRIGRMGPHTFVVAQELTPYCGQIVTISSESDLYFCWGSRWQPIIGFKDQCS